MTVRTARPSDVLGIATVHVRSWEATYRGIMPDDLLDSMTLDRRIRGWSAILGSPRDGVTFVAEEAGRVVGFIDVRPSPDGPAGAGEVAALYVDPDAWGAGHGRRLMEAGLEHLRATGHARATLRVLDANERGRRFYERGGWHVAGPVVLDDHCGAPLPELTYAIELTP